MAIQHIATVFCDYLIRSDTGKPVICGVFKNFQSSAFPFSKGPVGLYVEMTGENGDPFRVSIEGNGISIDVATGTITRAQTLVENQQESVIIAGEIHLSFTETGTIDVILRSGELVVSSVRYGVLVRAQENEANDV
jgi:hypothetical protein